MLSDVALWLAEQSHMTSVVARGRERLYELVRTTESYDGVIRPVCVDYRNDRLFRHSLEAAISAFGPVELAVCWIHSTAPRALRVVAEVTNEHSDTVRLLHVRGSATSNPSRPNPELDAAMAAYTGLTYERVVLGFVRAAGGSRWLTHAEIASGVIRAIQQPAAKSVVGTVEPWSDHPGTFKRSTQQPGSL